MAIEKKLIHFGKLADFEAQLTAGNILDRSIVFIQDAKKIWTHGTYYDCSEGGAKVYEWFYDGESKYVLLSQEEYNNIIEADIVVVNFAGAYSFTVSKSGKEISEEAGRYSLIGQLEGEGVKLYININIEISTKVATITAEEQEIPTKTSQLENDSNFVSSDGLKTINGESIVGSGDITISGGGSSSGSGAYSEVNHGTSDTTFALTPNTFHIWEEVSNLTLTLGSETSGVANEFLFQFTSGATATSLTLPDDIKWANDSAPTIEPNMIYQVSILKGLASVLEFANAPALIENKATVSISGTKYLVSLQYAAASDIIVKVRTMDGPISVSILSGEISKSASGVGPMMDSGAYIESITPANDTTYNYIW